MLFVSCHKTQQHTKNSENSENQSKYTTQHAYKWKIW